MISVYHWERHRVKECYLLPLGFFYIPVQLVPVCERYNGLVPGTCPLVSAGQTFLCKNWQVWDHIFVRLQRVLMKLHIITKFGLLNCFFVHNENKMWKISDVARRLYCESWSIFIWKLRRYVGTIYDHCDRYHLSNFFRWPVYIRRSLENNSWQNKKITNVCGQTTTIVTICRCTGWSALPPPPPPTFDAFS